MKKLFLALTIIALPLIFTSCGDDDPTDILSNLVGSMTMNINGKSQTFTGVGFYTADKTTYLATANLDNVVAVKLDDVSAKTYTLGVFSDEVLSSLISGNLNLSKFDNIMAFRPNGDELYIVVTGSFKVNSISNQMSGTFSGNAVKASYVKSLYDNGNTDYSALLSLITGSSAEVVKISGSFNAQQSNAIKNIFGNVFSK